MIVEKLFVIAGLSFINMLIAEFVQFIVCTYVDGSRIFDLRVV